MKKTYYSWTVDTYSSASQAHGTINITVELYADVGYRISKTDRIYKSSTIPSITAEQTCIVTLLWRAASSRLIRRANRFIKSQGRVHKHTITTVDSIVE